MRDGPGILLRDAYAPIHVSLEPSRDLELTRQVLDPLPHARDRPRAGECRVTSVPGIVIGREGLSDAHIAGPSITLEQRVAPLLQGLQQHPRTATLSSGEHGFTEVTASGEDLAATCPQLLEGQAESHAPPFRRTAALRIPRAGDFLHEIGGEEPTAATYHYGRRPIVFDRRIDSQRPSGVDVCTRRARRDAPEQVAQGVEGSRLARLVATQDDSDAGTERNRDIRAGSIGAHREVDEAHQVLPPASWASRPC